MGGVSGGDDFKGERGGVDALTEKMIEGASVTECLVAIEDASSRA